MSTSYVTE